MKTAEQIAQWVIDNRYPKSENEKVSDVEMYHELVESIAKLCTIPRVSQRSELLSDFEKWLDKKGNESYCSLPAGYVVDKYKSLNCA